jgi:hypothetical protein
MTDINDINYANRIKVEYPAQIELNNKRIYILLQNQEYIASKKQLNDNKKYIKELEQDNRDMQADLLKYGGLQ